jgi:hypothetical protein
MIAVITMDDLNNIFEAKRDELYARLAVEQDHDKRMGILASLASLSDVRFEASKKLEIAHVFKVGA